MVERPPVLSIASPAAFSMEDFVPESTLSAGQLRLFTISPGKGDEHIEITLNVSSIASQENCYIAISYAWESTELTHPIICNGKRLKITANLYGALNQLREDNENGQFWADAICIHQNNVNEKTQQVRDMSSIFRGAKLVIIWLGLEDDTTIAGLEMLRKIDEATDEFRLTVEGYNTQQDFSVFEKVGLPGLRSPAWRALGNIYRRAWFSRVWVLRELVEARETLMMIGSHRADTSIVVRALDRICNNEALSISLTVEEATPVLLYAGALSNFMFGDPQSNDSFLCILFFLTRFFLCTDPRDRFFAIADCSSLSASHMVDYELSIQQVTMLAARENVKHQQSPATKHDAIFLMLSLVDSRYLVPDIPSWCPTYHCGKDFGPFAIWWAPGEGITGSKLQGFVVDDNNRLILTGHCIDEVVSYIEMNEVQRTARMDPETIDGVQVIHHLGRLSLEVEQKCYELATNTLKDMTTDEVRTLYLQCITLGRKQSGTSSEEQPKDLTSQYEAMKLLWSTAEAMLNVMNLDKPQRFTVFLDQFPDLYQKVVEQGTSDDPRPTILHENNRLITESSWITLARRFAWSGRNFCSTDGHRIGFVPVAARTGDRICFFDGWDMPFVLRPVSESPEDGYKLIGSCYVEGLMYGAALEHLGQEETIKIV